MREEKKIEDGGPAYPCKGDADEYWQTGLTKREAVAMAAMQSLITNYFNENIGDCEKMIVHYAFVIADAFLEKSREKI